jgi:hypothetical protein
MMMNNKPKESQIEEESQNDAISSNDSLDGKISVSHPIDVRPNDVLCGRSKASFNHGGSLAKFLGLIAFLLI